MPSKLKIIVGSLTLLLGLPAIAGPLQAPTDGFVRQTITPEDIAPTAFAQWNDGQEQPLKVQDGAKHVMWTSKSEPSWDGVKFGEGKNTGLRHLRIGFTRAVPIGSVLVRAGGQLSFLKPVAASPGRLNDESQWLPATRISERQPTNKEVGREEYAVWVLPKGTTTRALRFTHNADAADREYHGWLGSVYILADRVANVAPFAVVSASANAEKADHLVNDSNDGTWARGTMARKGRSKWSRHSTRRR